MNYYRRALDLEAETLQTRRHLHQHPEVGLDLPETLRFVSEKLAEYGLSPTPCGHGLTALLGHGAGPVLLLRADMDALPIHEESGEPFASQNGAMHACGHDLHTAMLLTAARMLKENEHALQGQIKLMFQPGEETFQGAEDMLQNGLSLAPAPSAALAFHVAIGKAEPGAVYYSDQGVMMNSVDGFRLTVHGRSSHGACPEAGIDPINIAVHIYLALESLLARETPPTAAVTLTVGQFHAGSAANVIPDSACLEGTLRCDDQSLRDKLLDRLQAVAVKTADVYGGSVTYEPLSSVPPLRCDPALSREMAGYLQDLPFPGLQIHPGARATASEDFATLAQRLPACYMYLTAGFPDERGDYPVHHPKARFNEAVLPLGAAAMAHCATQYLAHHAP